MLRSLLSGVSALPGIRRLADWRHDLLFYWLTWNKGHLAFFSAMALMLVALVLMVRFAVADRMRIEAERQRNAELTCLAENIYFEARGESLAGQYAVAEVTMNRVASPRFPATVCEVVHEKRWDPLRRREVGAFSWTELGRMPRPAGGAWQRAMAAARAVYDREQTPRVPGALFYHARHMEPYWARTQQQVATIGRHVFYR